MTQGDPPTSAAAMPTAEMYQQQATQMAALSKQMADFFAASAARESSRIWSNPPPQQTRPVFLDGESQAAATNGSTESLFGDNHTQIPQPAGHLSLKPSRTATDGSSESALPI